MPLGTSSNPERRGQEIQRELQQAAEEAREALTRATDPAERARAAEHLKVAVRRLLEWTLPGSSGSSGTS